MKVRTNFRVVASVDTNTWEKDPKKIELRMDRRARDLMDEIRRHCDSHEALDIEWDVECSHCGYKWEVDDKGEPVCCDEAQNEWAVQAGAPSPQNRSSADG